MATAYTSLLGLALPVTGELSGTWGDVVNNYLTSYVDASVAGSQTISGSQTSVTLSTTNGTALSQAGGAGTTGSSQYFIINCTGNPSGTLTITAPASSKTYIVINATSTSQSVKIVGTGPTTGVTIASGDKALVAWNGSDFVRVGASVGGSNTQVQYNNGGNLAGSANLTFDGTNLTSGGTVSATKLIPTGGAATGNGMYLPASNTLAWSNNGSETMRLDSSGNLGLGVTPSAWTTSWKALQIAATSSLSDYSGQSTYWNNCTVIGATTPTYQTTAAASFYRQSGGVHYWFNAPSGTAGNAITFTQAMTLFASGALWVGSSSEITGGQGYFGLNGASGSGAGPAIGFAQNGTFLGGIGQQSRIGGSGTNQDIFIQAQAASNNVGLNAVNGYLYFQTGSTERARIDSSGNFGIGLTPVANNGILQLNSYASVQAMMEKATVSATAATGTINFDAATQAVLYYTTNSSGNWTINIRGNSGLTLNNMMQTGQSLTLAFLATNGSTAYYQSALTIDGSSVTPKWQGGTAPTAGNASAIDAYVLTVIKTGSATFTVLASQTKFA